MADILYRLYEMVLWLVFLIVNIPYTMIMTIPYLCTGHDYITPLASAHEWLLFKKKEAPVSIFSDRRQGNSTRLVDHYVQKFFKEGECRTMDHYDSRGAHNRIFKLIINRLKHEHNIDRNYLDLKPSEFLIRNPFHKRGPIE